MSDDLDKVKEIIANSGNTFHSNVLKYFQDNGWTVLISPYYNDNVSNKPREIDLIAEKAFDAKDSLGRYRGTVNVKLFIERKYIAQNTVFWFYEKDIEKAVELVVSTTPARKDHVYTKKFHYLEGNASVAKLFAGGGGGKQPENEIFYKALNQSLNALVYYRNMGSIIKIPDGRQSRIVETVNYPVIVCNSFEKLFKVNTGDDDDPSNITENFQLEVNYAYLAPDGTNRTEYFLIDILNFDLLGGFLEQIEKDAGMVSFFKLD